MSHLNADLVPPGAPTPGLPYSSTLRTTKARWWKPAVGIPLGMILMLVASFAASLGAMAIDASVFGRPFDFTAMTPMVYAGSLLGLVALIPITWFLVRVIHRQSWGWNSSVQQRLRWQLILTPVPLLLVLFLAYMIVFTPLFADQGGGGRSPQWLTFLLIGVLLMPLQAAAEEIFFRGYVQRAAGSWFSGQRAALIGGTTVSAVLFASAHLATDPWLNLYYLAFGVALSIATQLTGGLEAAIAIHVVNNVVAGAVASYTTDVTQMFDRSAGVGGPFMLVQIAVIGVSAAALVWWSRRRQVATRVAAA
ncbi:membrane protease YdiL (CAAX protease family) [Kineosphaera limosa]|uniref:CAAX prenyl protease 2/Lysostaphin resistance protein A-like domain-containing protein n=1 Tax=Kineosphaera limosa NBRC 100340 TaxID=1184609 RepID=K6X6Z6_9MICO|nr:type II CAAX endopeptidase family protein [Kineosphaera limosa]NYD99419.1 membrane protease YdiL (CAAX protease family) [Kineosphaera limosa]GAB94599.1 hypothetical protein KILIM_007_00370 [Kineosphaera limosa NBRC 100340]